MKAGWMALAATLLAGVAVVAGQNVSPSEAEIVPVEREPRHRPVFRNDVLAVIDVLLPPGYTSLWHRHSNDNVSVRIATAASRTDTPTETGTIQTAAVGRLVFNSANPPYVHRIADVGTTPIRIIDIEVLARPGTPRASAADAVAGHEIVVDNDRVRLSRMVLPAGAQLPAHTHPRGWLEVVVTGGEPGAFTWHEPGSTMPGITAPAGGFEHAEIEVK